MMSESEPPPLCESLCCGTASRRSAALASPRYLCLMQIRR
uniref:Uncharacterized protein n=1 Tax=Arundo donax TaxID=35708 RepID=A0A0A9DEL7_ARUDO